MNVSEADASARVLVLRDGGTAILGAECAEGAGARADVALLEPFARRWLPPGSALVVVSSLDEVTVSAAGGTWAPSLAAALAFARDRAGKPTLDVAVMPDASDLVPRSTVVSRRRARDDAAVARPAR